MGRIQRADCVCGGLPQRKETSNESHSIPAHTMCPSMDSHIDSQTGAFIIPQISLPPQHPITHC